MSKLCADSARALVEQHVAVALWVAKQYPAPPGFDLDDLRQAALMGLFEAARAFDPMRGTFRPYAFRACRRAVARHCGKRREQPFEQADVENIFADSDPAERLYEIEAAARVERFLAGLDWQTATVVRLRRCGYAIREVASAVGHSKSWVCGRIEEAKASARLEFAA